MYKLYAKKSWWDIKKLSSFTAALLFLASTIIGSLTFILDGRIAEASTAVTVNSSTPGWSTADTRTDGYVDFVIDPSAPLGNGSLSLSTGPTLGQDKAQYMYTDTTDLALSDLSELSYYTNTNHSTRNASIQLVTDVDGDGNVDTTLVYETYYNGTNVLNTWQQWDASTGVFWPTVNFGSFTGAGGGGNATNFTLTSVLADYPNARIKGFGLNLGSYNPSTTSLVDAFDFNGTVYDFEPILTPELNTENFNTVDANYKGVSVGFNAKNFGTVSAVTVDMARADGSHVIKTGNQGVFDIISGATTPQQLTAPFVMQEGTFTEASDTFYWNPAPASWTNATAPVSVTITVTDENGPVSVTNNLFNEGAPSWPTYASLVPLPITDSSEVVRASDMAADKTDAITNTEKWSFYNDETDLVDPSIGSFAYGPTTAPLGDGSVEITVSGSQRRNLATYKYNNVALKDITELKFSTYNASAGNGGSSNRSAYLQFNVDFDGDDDWQKRISYIPSQNGTVQQDTWQQWDAVASGTALWTWSGFSNSTPWPDGSTDRYRTWDDLLNAFPAISTRTSDSWFGFRVGEPYSDGYTENIDNFVIGISDGTEIHRSTVDFEPVAIPACNVDDAGFVLGSINGQNGWTVTGQNYDQEIAINSYGFTELGCNTFRLSNAHATGSFGDQTFSYSTTNEAGETDSTNAGKSGGVRQNHFEAEFDIASTMFAQQPGLSVSVSPDRGDGSRMSYIGFADGTSGIDVTFYDTPGTSNPANFSATSLATLDRSTAHKVKFVIDYVDGPSNDVVKVYIDGSLVHTGTTWENYYRYDSEAVAEQSPRTTDSLTFLVRGASVPSNIGNGYLFDNVRISTETIPPDTSGVMFVNSPKYVRANNGSDLSAQIVTLDSTTEARFYVDGSTTPIAGYNVGGAGATTDWWRLNIPLSAGEHTITAEVKIGSYWYPVNGTGTVYSLDSPWAQYVLPATDGQVFRPSDNPVRVKVDDQFEQFKRMLVTVDGDTFEVLRASCDLRQAGNYLLCDVSESLTWANLAEGNYSATTTTYTKANNRFDNLASYSFNIDGTAPIILSQSFPDYASATLAGNVTAEDIGGFVESVNFYLTEPRALDNVCTGNGTHILESRVFSATSGNLYDFNLDTSSLNGEYCINAIARDGAKNNSIIVRQKVIIDNTKPTGSATYIGDNEVDGIVYVRSINNLSFTETVDDNHSAVRATFLVQKLNTTSGSYESFCGNWNANSLGSHTLGGSNHEVYTETNVGQCKADQTQWTDGTYKIFHAAYDAAGNEGKYNADRQIFVIDDTAPNFTMTDDGSPRAPVVDGNVLNPELLGGQDIRFAKELNEDLLYVNGSLIFGHGYPNNKTGKIVAAFGNEGVYELFVRDRAGNQSDSIFITVDKTSATGTITYSNNNGNQLVNSDVTATLTTSEWVEDISGWSRVSDTQFTKVFTDNGKFNLNLIDVAGNSSVVSGEVKRIDRNAPTFNGVVDGTTVAGPVTLKICDPKYQGFDGFSASNGLTLNGVTTPTAEAFDSVCKFYLVIVSNEGDYTAEATDKAGNSTSISFSIDNSAPVQDFLGMITEDTTPTINGTTDDAVSVVVEVNGQTLNAAVSGTTWSVTVPVALATGEYDVVVTGTDTVGNSATATFTDSLEITGTTLGATTGGSGGTGGGTPVKTVAQAQGGDVNTGNGIVQPTSNNFGTNNTSANGDATEEEGEVEGANTEENGEVKQAVDENSVEESTVDEEESSSSNWWLWVLIALIVGGIGYYFYKNTQKADS